ncbi:ionotropic receptor 75a-like [Vanessa cardui]|uniref:ionotropic receptor 75a-like n=1 Tax=Vanessa cardui TaxID=171605 RepID=UPI001F1382DC|nr:ionotropic receptor 75a-like [Vanessa cardui]
MFRSPFRWILIDRFRNESENLNIQDSITQIDILIDTEVYVVRKIENYYYIIYRIYKIGPESEWITELYNYWNSSTGLQRRVNQAEVTALRRMNLEGYELKICYVLTDNDSFNHLTDEVNDHIDTITKVNFPTTNQLMDFLNASRKYVFTDTWGYSQNNTWNGMTGFLEREEVDIGGSPMFLTSERLSIVEYISSPTPTRSKFVFQQPKLSYENNLFLLSFNYSLWYGSIALICTLYLVICLVTVWEWKQKKTTKKIESGVLRPNVIDVALFTFGAACQQGSTVELKGALGRMVLLLLFVALTFLYTSYSANIVALLQSSSSQIRTLEDLLHSRIKFGVHDTVFNRHYFKTETEPVRRAIYKTKVAPPGTEPRFISMEKGVKEMKKGLFAFHMETGVGYKFVGKYFEEGEKCGLKEIQFLRVIDPWLAVRKNTQFMEMFKIGTKRLQEHGLQQRENHLLYEKRPKCVGRQANFVSVSMVDCYPALLLLTYGALLAAVVTIIEIIHHNRNRIISTINDKKMGLINEINYEGPQKPIQFVDSFTSIRINAVQNIIILTDLNCPNSSRFMEQVKSFGTWSARQGLNKTNDMSVEITIRRKDLGGLPIAASLVITSNETKKQLLNLRDLHIDFITKASFRQLDPLYYFLNASRVLIFTDNWGYIVNGSYNGMIGDIVREVAELTGTLGRVVMFLMFLAFLFLYTSYSANIVALLQSSSNQINTLADLLNSKLELGAEETPYNRHHFLAATDPIKKAIYEKKIAPRGYKPNFMSLEEGVRRLQKKPFAFNMFLGGGYKLVEKYFLEHEKCDLQEIEYIEENKPWLACRKNSPLKEMYKIGLFRNQEHGLNSRANLLIYAKKPACIVHGGTFDSVNMTDFYPALLMLAYGMILAVILLLLEMFHWRKYRVTNT